LAGSPDEALVLVIGQNEILVDAQRSSQPRGVGYPQWIVDPASAVELRRLT
jgi:hypothetical protein